MSRLKKKPKRNRIIYGILISIVIILGLGSRMYYDKLPNFIASYSGDILWGLMVYLGMGFIFKRYSIFEIGVYSIAFSFLIEISQLYHSSWIDGIRKIKLGGLILGYGFLWTDLVCYSMGILIGILLERLIIFKNKNKLIKKISI